VRQIWLILALSGCAFAQSPILETVKKLQSFPVEDGNTDVAPELGRLHQQLKHQLRDFAIEAMNRGADIDTELARKGIALSAKEGDPHYGQILKVAVDRKPNGLPTWAALKTTLGVMCGEDSSLYLLEREDTGWKVRLAVESELKKDVSTALGWPVYGFSKAGLDDRFLLVSTNINPWCSSVWQTLRVTAYVITTGPNHAKRVFNEDKTICIEDDVDMQVQGDGFQVKYLGEMSLSPGNRRTHIRRYALTENGMKRVAPIAEGAQDFVDEWRSMPWDEAKMWSSADLSQWHARLKTRENDDIAESPCTDPPARWQVRVTTLPDDSVFAIVVKKDGAFFLQSMGTKPARGCPVPELGQ